jgi:hypothetical protein
LEQVQQLERLTLRVTMDLILFYQQSRQQVADEVAQRLALQQVMVDLAVVAEPHSVLHS